MRIRFVATINWTHGTRLTVLALLNASALYFLNSDQQTLKSGMGGDRSQEVVLQMEQGQRVRQAYSSKLTNRECVANGLKSSS